MRKTQPALLLLGALTVSAFFAAPAADAQSDTAAAKSPWTLLGNLRDALQTSGPMTSRFVQTYVPAGFSEGDEEKGQLSMWFPDCLRWNYDPPDEKNFLVCQGEVYAWTGVEPGGRRYRIDPEAEPGLDLLLVPVDTLRERYVASSQAQPDGSWVIALATPPSDAGAYKARIHMSAETQRVLELQYTDTEGNQTRFRISDYQSINHTALFQPPVGIEWTTP